MSRIFSIPALIVDYLTMLSKIMEQALNKRVNRELYSAYHNLSMSSYFGAANLKGFANWLRVQAKEEQSHALKIYDHIIARGAGLTSLISKLQKQNGTPPEKCLRKYMPMSKRSLT